MNTACPWEGNCWEPGSLPLGAAPLLPQRVHGEREILLLKGGTGIWALTRLRCPWKNSESSSGRASPPEREKESSLGFPTFSKNSHPWLGNKQSFLFFFFSSLFKCVGFKWQWKVSVLIQQLQQFVPQHERWGDCHVHWKRRDPWRRSVTEFALLFLI